MMYPVIDVGSNTVRLCVYGYDGVNLKTLFTKKAMVGLAGHCKAGKMTQAGVEKLCATLQKFQDTLVNFETAPVAIFATASLRNVENCQQVLDIVHHRTGLTVEVIAGEEEARLDFIGATAHMDMKDGILVDIGGGSTEIVLFAQGVIQKAVSIPIGSLNSYSQYVEGFLPTKKECGKLKKAVTQAVEEVLADTPIPQDQLVCGVGGTIRATCKLSNHLYDLPTGHQQMSMLQVQEVYKVLCGEHRKSVEMILDVVPDRLRTIVTGMTILRAIGQLLQVKAIHVSNFGVREGYFYDRVAPETQAQSSALERE